MTKQDLKIKLLQTNYFDDNEYLNTYIDIIFNNLNTKYIKGKTQRHHYIPICYYKDIYKAKNRKEAEIISDSLGDNLIVNLYYSDHVKVHCLLSLASNKDSFRLANNFAIYKMPYKLEDSELLQKVYEQNYELRKINNPMHKQDMKDKHDSIMRSSVVRLKISSRMKGREFSESHKNNLKKAAKNRKGSSVSSSGYVGGLTGLKRIYTPDDQIRYVRPEEVQNYLDNGYKLKRSYKPKNKRHMNPDDLRQKLSLAHQGQEPWNKGLTCKESTKVKISETLKNSRWITKDGQDKKIKKEELELYINLGWKPGRSKGGDMNEKVSKN